MAGRQNPPGADRTRLALGQGPGPARSDRGKETKAKAKAAAPPGGRDPARRRFIQPQTHVDFRGRGRPRADADPLHESRSLWAVAARSTDACSGHTGAVLWASPRRP